GLLDEPINPTMRDDTVTKKAPKIMMSNPNNNLLKIELPGIKVPGINAITINKTILPMPTTFIERSLSVLGTFASTLAPFFFNDPILPLKDEMIVGIVFIKVIKPP